VLLVLFGASVFVSQGFAQTSSANTKEKIDLLIAGQLSPWMGTG
jgi:hypothetical protein